MANNNSSGTLGSGGGLLLSTAATSSAVAIADLFTSTISETAEASDRVTQIAAAVDRLR